MDEHKSRPTIQELARRYSRLNVMLRRTLRPASTALQPEETTASPSLDDLRLEYCGFRDTEDSREYVISARLLGSDREYVVAIEHAAFTARHLLFQEGPDICFQRLRRELLGKELTPLPALMITIGELTDYRNAHPPVAHR